MTNRGNRRFKPLLLAACAALAIVPAAASAQQVPAPAQITYDIPAQDLGTALTELARQSNREIYFSADLTRGKHAPRLRGHMPVERALDRLLRGSGLTYQLSPSGAITIESAMGNGQDGAELASSDGGDVVPAEQAGISEILVVGSRSQNVDIRRTENDAQPYVVFDKKQIEQSNSSNLEEFLRKRLPMNTQAQAASQSMGASAAISNISQINLRGLGVGQTLILVDGRRAPRLTASGAGLSGTEFTQADINGIPLAAIERIEILPSTAGGIYGGGAVGGVINIIRKRNYRGIDVNLGTDGSFHGGAETVRAEASGGFALEGGRTQVSFSAAYVGTDPLYAKDVNLTRRSRELFFAPDNGETDFFVPFGFLTNIKSLEGPLTLKDGTPLNSTVTHVPVGYAGPSSDGGAAFVATAGRFDLGLSNDAVGKYAPLMGKTKVKSANLNVRRSFASWLDVFVDFTASKSSASGLNISGGAIGSIALAPDAPNNPFEQYILVAHPLMGLDRPFKSNSSTVAGAIGGVARLNRSWSAIVEYDWRRAHSTSTRTDEVLTDEGAAALTDGTLDVLRDLNAFPIDFGAYSNAGPDAKSDYKSIQQILSGRISGTVARLPGGPISLTLLAERRWEDAPAYSNIGPLASFHFFPRSQNVNSAYGEVNIPIFSDKNARPFFKALEVQGSIRHDRYVTAAVKPANYNLAVPAPETSPITNKARSTDFTLAARWAPAHDLSFRASYATGFLPPSIARLVSSPPRKAIRVARDPQRGNELVGSVTSPVTIIAGGNPDLKPENSKSLSFGAVLTPTLLPGFRFSIDYTRIKKSDEVGVLAVADLVAHEEDFPGRVLRSTDPSTFGPYALGPIILIDQTQLNFSRSRVKALDVQADYEIETGRLGKFQFYGIVTRQFELERQIIPTSMPYDSVDSISGPLKWKANGGVDWVLGRLMVTWNTQFYSGYSLRNASESTPRASVVYRQGASRVPIQVYHDLGVRYSLARSKAPFLHNLEIAAGIENVFDTKPRVIASDAATGGYSPYGDVRLRRYTISLRRHFGW